MGVGVAVGVAVDVAVGVAVGVAVNVAVAVAVAVGLLVAHRSHDADNYYERDHEGPSVVGPSYPSGLD